MMALDRSRPLEFKGSTKGSVFAVECSFGKAYLVPTPLDKDYPLRFTESSTWIRATTVVIKNLPDGFTRDALAALLVCLGYGGLFDMIYVPCDYSDLAPYAYAFCNMKTHENALQLKQALHGRTWGLDTGKVCEVRFATTQGFGANVDRYRNMPCNHESIRDQFGPMVYDRIAQPFLIQPSQYIVPPKAKKTSGRHGDRSSRGCSLANIVAVISDVSKEGWTIDWSDSWGSVLQAQMEGRRPEDYTVFNESNQVIDPYLHPPDKIDFPLRFVFKDSGGQIEGGLSEAETVAGEDSPSGMDGMILRGSEAVEESDEDSASDMDVMPRSQSAPALALVGENVCTRR